MKRFLILALLAAGCTSGVQARPAIPACLAGADELHCRVGSTDTWGQIAAAHRVTSNALEAANGTSVSDSSHPLTGRILHVPDPTITPTTTAPTTTAPATTTTTPATTTPSTTSSTTSTTTTSTTVPPSSTTSTSPAPTTTSTAPPTTTVPPSGAAFFEDFSTPGAFRSRFDFDWAGEVQSGSLFGENRNDWHGDHDMACGDPALTGRTIHVEPPDNEPFAQQNGLPKDVSQVFYQCAPGGDNAKAHVMTSVDTAGYVAAWFSPKQIFHNVTRICFDLNLTDMGGGKWPVVTFLTPTEYQGETDLGYTTQRFPGGNGEASTPQGAAAHGVDLAFGGMRIWNNHQLGSSVGGVTVADKAARYRHCIVDNGNGTVTLSHAQPGGATNSSTVVGFIPDGDLRVVFIDDNYNPPKRDRYNPQALTWHWDNIEVS